LIWISPAERPPDVRHAADGRGERIRTSGPCLPKTVLYQAELLPDRNPLCVRPTVAAGAKAAAR
jgi:hypothetical protein